MDAMLGEPSRAHPLVGFGKLASRIEHMLNLDWVHRFDVVPSLRFGLPADEAAWSRLEAALILVKTEGEG